MPISAPVLSRWPGRWARILVNPQHDSLDDWKAKNLFRYRFEENTLGIASSISTCLEVTRAKA
ncbi:hypothetical protein KCP74_01945 [Salmonella enterica subsp. enterica]|nr:hypothetical protein KCP74_01945 [Salmonella enterica subsp. enterica]